jgi:prophage maintenance system killer protein
MRFLVMSRLNDFQSCNFRMSFKFTCTFLYRNDYRTLKNQNNMIDLIVKRLIYTFIDWEVTLITYLKAKPLALCTIQIIT